MLTWNNASVESYCGPVMEKKMIPPNLIGGIKFSRQKRSGGSKIFNPPDPFCLKKTDPTMEKWSPCQKLYMSTRYINCIFDIAIHSQLDQKLRLEYIHSLNETTCRKYGMRQVILWHCPFCCRAVYRNRRPEHSASAWFFSSPDTSDSVAMQGEMGRALHPLPCF